MTDQTTNEQQTTSTTPCSPYERLRAVLAEHEGRKGKAAERTAAMLALLGDVTLVAALATDATEYGKFTMLWATKKLAIAPIRTAVNDYRRAAKGQQEQGGPVEREYSYDGNRTSRIVYKEGQPSPVLIADCVAEVVAETSYDSGHETIDTSRTYRVQVTTAAGRTLAPVDVDAAEWREPQWMDRLLGTSVGVQPGSFLDFLEATRQNSTPERRTVYTSPGWRALKAADGTEGSVYLMPGGTSIMHDAEGNTLLGAEVQNPDPQGRMGMAQLPTLPDSDEIDYRAVREAVWHSLETLVLGYWDVTSPVFAAAYAAPFASMLGVNFSLYLVGGSGSVKTGLASLACDPYGAYDYSSPTLFYTSTPNAIEERLFQMKDMAVLIDDFRPNNPRMLDTASRIIQQIAGGTRDRLNRNSEAMQSRPCRAMVIQTGEDVPALATESGAARMLIVRVQRGDLKIHETDPEPEGSMRRAIAVIGSAEGRAKRQIAMRMYLTRVAQTGLERHLDYIRDLKKQIQKDYMRIAKSRGIELHPRTIPAAATLMACAKAYLAFAEELLPTKHEVISEMTSLVAQAIETVAMNQAQFSGPRAGEAPPERWLSAIRAMLVSNQVSLEHKDSDLRETSIGWQDGEYVYLQGDLAWRAVSEFHRAQGWGVAHHARELYRQLADRQIIERPSAADGAYQGIQVHRRCGGRQQWVYLIPRHHLADALGQFNDRKPSDNVEEV